MMTNVSCQGPCPRPRSPIPACLLLIYCIGLAACVAMLAGKLDAARDRMDRIARDAEAVKDMTDGDIHAAHRRIDEAEARLRAEIAAEPGRRNAQVAREARERKAELARLDDRITDALTRDVIGLGENILDDRRKIERLEKRFALVAASLESLEMKACRCRPAAPTTPPAPGKALPGAVAPGSRP